ncbi:MAG: transglycosylase domain-containing protein [Spirochaetales bacterium]
MKPPHSRVRKPALHLALVSILTMLLVSAASLGIYVYRIIAATPSVEEYESAQSRTSSPGSSGVRPPTDVSIDDVPSSVIHAVVAIEDRRFFQHRGIDLRGIVRAAWENLQAGRIVQGASTITQQLARTRYLSLERTLERKIAEGYLALQLEMRYDKAQILEMYLNSVYFGAGATGVQAASQRFFGKPVEEVNTTEAAMLAGSLRSPRHYNPVTNPQRAKRRLSVVLAAMESAGVTSADQAMDF